MKKLVSSYFNTFNGLSKEVWWLALITLINRAGTMVIPFLSLYLTQSLNFSLTEVGWVMALFGLGSVIGSWLGGKLTDRIGYYKVMVISLMASGISFIFLQYITSFVGFCIGVLILMAIADMFRPAMFVALSSYSKPENRTRSITLIRLAINLGFSAGPALGGLIIFTLGYGGLFWIDGITCFVAGILLLQILNPRKAKAIEQLKVINPTRGYTDKAYMILLVAMTLFGLAFFQLLSTLPIFYKDVHHLTEAEIGLLLGLNGFLIFIFEMPLIKWLEGSKNNMSKLILIGVLLTALSFIVINLSGWIGALIIGMVFMTFGEMIVFPFSNSLALNRSIKGNQGQYMAYYSISFSIAHIFGHSIGMNLVANLGYKYTWYIVSLLALLSAAFMLYLMHFLKREKVAATGSMRSIG
ncbi:MDR family MFS transporter [Arenibacter troitsensis]|uniref:Predicted arabinose efflux permease, MFS family n=1 Tax=Arenibacter troitsensis TaxID=188872 RepID=A0A1X7IS36_9FLAO|nr:MFS transporter [Arenibacter troitsensis]SMG17554.1 Predicted arabinose efflux permease, MFS family [Arenibacter troitsensis]